MAHCSKEHDRMEKGGGGGGGGSVERNEKDAKERMGIKFKGVRERVKIGCGDRERHTERDS